MKVLVTGGNGFVGKELISSMLSQGTYTPVSGVRKKNKVENHNDELNIVELGNLEEAADMKELLKDFDVIVHTAARVHKMNDLSKNPLSDFMETNCLGTLNLARQAANFGVKRFIFLSSIKVNGERTQPNNSFRFDDERKGEDAYAKSKAEAEIGLLKIADDTQLEVVIIRSPLVYGPGVKANFAALLKLASKNLPLPLSSIENKRSFVSVDNLVSLIVTCIDHPKAANQIFLVSDDSDISTSELFTIMVEAFGNKARLFKINPSFLKSIARLIGKKSMIDRLCDDLTLDIQHTKDSLDWTPVVSTAEGIKLCVSKIITNK